MTSETIGDRIQLIRGGQSQTAFAELLGLSRSSLVRYERGERQPDAELLERVCRQFNINGHWLLTGFGPMREAAGALPASATREGATPGGLASSWEHLGGLRASALGLGQLAEVARLGAHAGPVAVLRALEDGSDQGATEREIAGHLERAGRAWSPADVRMFLTFLARSGRIVERAGADGAVRYAPARRTQTLTGTDLAAVDEVGLAMVEALLRTVIPASEAGCGKVVCSTVRVPTGTGRELGREIHALVQKRWEAASEGPGGDEALTVLLGVAVHNEGVLASEPGHNGDPERER